jgi:phenylalanyl-tRNA synthetase beta chain
MHIKKTGNASVQLSEGFRYDSGNTGIVYFGKVKKAILKKFDIKGEVFYAEFNWDAIIKLVKNNSVKYKEVPKFPEVRRDLAMLIDRTVTYEQLEQIAFAAEKSLLKKVNVFDVYEGDKIEPGKRSYALSFILQDDNATLTDKQIDSVMQKLQRAYEEKAGAKIRSN